MSYAMHPAMMPGFGDPATWPPCDGHPLDPRTPDLDWPLDEWTAEELARDEVEATPYSLYWLIQATCQDSLTPLPVEALAARLRDGQTLDVPELVAVLMHCAYDGPITAALMQLRDALRESAADVIRDRTAELLREQRREDARERKAHAADLDLHARYSYRED